MLTQAVVDPDVSGKRQGLVMSITNNLLARLLAVHGVVCVLHGVLFT